MSKRRKKRGRKKMTQMTVGLDVGYGVTKLVNGQTITFPSVAGYARELKFQQDEISAKYPGDQGADDEGRWFVGDLALSQLSPASLLRLRGRTSAEVDGNAFRLRMMKTALGKLMSGLCDGSVIHIDLATGLPVDHMPDSHLLKQALLGQHHILTDQADFIANIRSVMVMPQPYGTIYRHLLNDDGTLNEYYTVARTGVIDVGTYTTDITLDDDGEYIDERSGSVEAGVHVVQEVVAAEYERRYRAKPSLRVIDEIIRRGFARIQGQPETFAETVTEGKQRLFAAVQTLLNARWQLAEDVDAIYVTGGGAALIYEQLHQMYGHAILSENAPTANAEGYLRYARYTEQG